MNSKMPDNLGLVEVRVFFEYESKRDILILIGFLWEDVLDIQEISEGFFVIFSDLIN